MGAADGVEPPRRLRDPAFLEKLAAVEHERWSHWQRYLHEQCEIGPHGSLTIPAELVERWTHQMNATYEDLSEAEKASDREQVERYLPLIEEALIERS